jgi:hypothetical protein
MDKKISDIITSKLLLRKLQIESDIDSLLEDKDFKHSDHKTDLIIENLHSLREIIQDIQFWEKIQTQIDNNPNGTN